MKLLQKNKWKTTTEIQSSRRWASSAPSRVTNYQINCKKEYYRLSSTCGAPRNHTNVQPVDAHAWRQLHLSAVARFSDSYCILFIYFFYMAVGARPFFFSTWELVLLFCVVILVFTIFFFSTSTRPSRLCPLLVCLFIQQCFHGHVGSFWWACR